MMDASTYSYRPYFDPNFESLFERIHPPWVCIDNDTCQDCTLIKVGYQNMVDSANKHGILLDMVQLLTDLDLVISKSYICSDGGWFMDVFHVTDHLGNKMTDQSLIQYIQKAMCTGRRGKAEVQTSIGRDVTPWHISTDRTALEMTGTDRPGLMSEISAVLTELGCHVSAAVVWTHNTRFACILYVEDKSNSSPITDPCRLAHVHARLENLMDAHHCKGERRSVRLAVPSTTHTERRLHQLMADNRDYDDESLSGGGGGGEIYWQGRRREQQGNLVTQVTIENCKEKRYSIVTVRSRDRPKLLFDTLCVLTDMQCVVFHAAISSQGSTAVQEYCIRQKDGCTLNPENERIVTKCLTAAVERRVSHGLRLDLSTQNRMGLLSDVTRVFTENGFSIASAELGTRAERAIGSFYVTDASGHTVNSDTVEAVRREIGGTILVLSKSSGRAFPQTSARRTSGSTGTGTGMSKSTSTSSDAEDGPKFSLGGLL